MNNFSPKFSMVDHMQARVLKVYPWETIEKFQKDNGIRDIMDALIAFYKTKMVREVKHEQILQTNG